MNADTFVWARDLGVKVSLNIGITELGGKYRSVKVYWHLRFFFGLWQVPSSFLRTAILTGKTRGGQSTTY